MDPIIKDGPYYRHFLESARFPYSEAEQACVERTVEKLIAHNTQGSRPGMLLGKIQSGKTKTFMAIMGLSFDNGFDVAVVLTKGTKALSKQTLERIQRDFEKFKNSDDVKIYDIMQMPKKLVGWELKRKLVFVVKKQKDNLDRLQALFTNMHPELSQKKVLIIDDEADYASVGYRTREGEVDANLTAVKLDELRTVVPGSSFLQVTATPYSLYLQPEEIEIRGEAFKPVRPAFTELVPIHPEYVGSDFYFNASEEVSLADYLYVPLSASELQVLKKPDGRRLKLDEVLTAGSIPGLRAAFCNFIVGGAIRQLQARYAGELPEKYSFLVHTETAKKSHDWQEKVSNALAEALLEGAEDASPIFDDLILSAYQELKPGIEIEGFYLPDFVAVRERVLEALRDGELLITSVNSDAQMEALLDDSGQLELRTPLNVFIGGQILDRGVTIGNLIGFYYGRRPNRFQQDTVLQHSRMYGYRSRKDLAVTRFYTEPTIYAAMQRMHESDVALREEIERNPDQEVIFIQGSGGGAVMPCSPNKILLSETTTLKPYKRILPVGFQTDYKSYTKPVTEKIDKLLGDVHVVGPGKQPFKIPLPIAHEVLKLSETVLFMEEEEGYTFDWAGMHATIDYLVKKSSTPTELWCLWLTDRNNARLAGVGSHTRYVATPDTATTEGAIARKYAIDSPMLMLFRQNGDEEKGWRGAPFYWPLLVAPKNTKTAIYAHTTKDS